MIANIMIANKTKTPIWSKGAIALIIDFKTTCKPIMFIIIKEIYFRVMRRIFFINIKGREKKKEEKDWISEL